MAMTDTEREAFLAEMNLAGPAGPTAPAGSPFPANAKEIPVGDIVFDPAWIAHITDLTPGSAGYKQAYELLFTTFRAAPRTGHDRNALLHRSINSFIASVRRANAAPTGAVTEGIRAGRGARDLAVWLEANGITAAQVAEALGLTK